MRESNTLPVQSGHMDRRAVLGLVGADVTGLSGCMQPSVTERPTGEIDVVFNTEARRDFLIRFEILLHYPQIRDYAENAPAESSKVGADNSC